MSNLLKNLRNLSGKFAPELVYNYYLLQSKFKKFPFKLLLLSHMRSGSSLLTHLLNTSPEIAGIGEMWINYSSEKDFIKLLAKVHYKLRKFEISEKYILDKLCHNHLIENLDILLSDDVYIIFLIRSPERSLKSQLQLFPDWTDSQALEYYTNRLSMLEKYAKHINNKSRSAVVTYEQIVEQSDSVLQNLQTFLSLQTPLSKKYQLLPQTGNEFIGDTSDNIKAGYIKKTDPNPTITIKPEILKESWQAFHSCYFTLSNLCSKLQELEIKN